MTSPTVTPTYRMITINLGFDVTGAPDMPSGTESWLFAPRHVDLTAMHRNGQPVVSSVRISGHRRLRNGALAPEIGDAIYPQGGHDLASAPSWLVEVIGATLHVLAAM